MKIQNENKTGSNKEDQEEEKENINQGTSLINFQIDHYFTIINTRADMQQNQQLILDQTFLNVRFTKGVKITRQLILRSNNPYSQNNKIKRLLNRVKNSSIEIYKQSQQKINNIPQALQNLSNLNKIYKTYSQKNQYLQYLDGLNQKIHLQSKKFMTSKNKIFINQLLKPLHSSSQCLECRKQFIQNQAYPSNGQLYTVISYNQNSQLFNEKMKQKICGLLNLNGGYLIIASQQRQYVRGSVQLLNKVQFWEEYYIKYIKNFLIPKQFHLNFEQVQVASKQNDNKVIIRMKVLPSPHFQTYFVQKNVDNKVFTYRFCQLKFKSGKISEVYTLERPHQFYKIIYRKYYQRKRFEKKYSGVLGPDYFKNSYRQCVPNYLQLLNKMRIKMGNQSSTQLQTLPNFKQNYQQEEPKFTKIEDKVPIIAYKNQSIIILNDASADILIDELSLSLKSSGRQCFLFVKPYTSYRSKSKKQMWFCSHQYPLPEVQNQIIQLKSKVQDKFLAIIGVTKYLFAQCNEKTLIELKKAFVDIFGYWDAPEKELIPHENTLFNFYFKLSEYQESVFIFIFLDNIRIRAQFYKETLYLDKIQTLKKIKNHKQNSKAYKLVQ